MQKQFAHFRKHTRRYLAIAGWLLSLAVMLFVLHYFTDNKLEGRMSAHVTSIAKQRADDVRPLLTPVGINLGRVQPTYCGIGDPEIGNYDCTVYVGATFMPTFSTMSAATIATRLDELDAKMKKAGWLVDANDFRSRSPNGRPYWENWFATEPQNISYRSIDGAAGCSVEFTVGVNNHPPQPAESNIFSCSESKQQ